MKKILLPTDFTPYSKEVAAYAFALAHDLWAEVHVLHVYHRGLSMGQPMEQGPHAHLTLADVVQDVKLEIQARIQRFMHPMQLESKVKVHYSVREGVPGDCILELCEQESMDLIVMGSRPTQRWHESLLGNVTSDVLEGAQVPVLVVPRGATYKGLKKIAYASDFSLTDGRNAWRLNKQLHLLKPELLAVHIADTEKERVAATEELSAQLSQQLHKYDEGLPISCHVIKDKDVGSGLETFLEQESPDLLAVTTHRRHLLEKWLNPSVTRKLRQNLAVPLWVMQD